MVTFQEYISTLELKLSLVMSRQRILNRHIPESAIVNMLVGALELGNCFLMYAMIQGSLKTHSLQLLRVPWDIYKWILQLYHYEVP